MPVWRGGGREPNIGSVAGIFSKVRLRPARLRTIAERRFGDAQCLCDSRQNERANGAMYMAGFVIEILLKSRLMEKYPRLQTTRSTDKLSSRERTVWSLPYRSHDLDEILGHLPDIRQRLLSNQRGTGERLWQNLSEICAQWTVFARYSPKSANMTNADEFLRKIKEIKECLQ